MTFVGIDLAADVKRTGLAVLREGAGNVVVDGVLVGATDEDLIDATQVAARAGVDVPFGWPKDFVETIYAHASGTLEAPASTGSEWRRNLALRATDQAVHQRTGLTPLSVSTDRIAYPALRWAGIEARLRDMGTEVARDGAGVVCEVYPAAALKVWGLPHRGYKGLKNSAKRAAYFRSDFSNGMLPSCQGRTAQASKYAAIPTTGNKKDSRSSRRTTHTLTPNWRAIPPPIPATSR